MFTLESPHRGDSNEYTQYTIFNMNKKNTLNYPKSAAMGFFSKGLKNEFETAVVNEPPVFEPLKFYCSLNKMIQLLVRIRSPFKQFGVSVGSETFRYLKIIKKINNESHFYRHWLLLFLLKINFSRYLSTILLTTSAKRLC